MQIDSQAELKKFLEVVERDKASHIADQALLHWLFVDRLHARNERVEMNFYGFDGRSHLKKFFQWQRKTEMADFLPAQLVDPLIKRSCERDTQCLARLDLSVPDKIVESIARYNAQDFVFQRAYPLPEAMRPRVVLDFGAGFGRMANLAFGAGASDVQLLIAVDAIPGPYLTQKVYYEGLGLEVAEYIDASPAFDFRRESARHQLIHIPTWRLDLIPDNSVDLVCCVQVLKELPGEVLIFALRHFSRILKARGAIYIRDHEQYHHPNQMPVNELLLSSGFALEFRPMLHDRVEIHGLPRIWRKFDSKLYLNSAPKPPDRKDAP
ncbi:MAG TPA: class I SAM-dependent methyltransferase [Rhizomicrobium sp.]|jgi:SAM-dependent methyltransferase